MNASSKSREEGEKVQRSPLSHRLAVVTLAAALSALAGCGGGSSPNDTTAASCGVGIGLGNPPCRCVSWTYVVELWQGCCCSDCVRPDLDRSMTPARVMLRVGQKFMVASHIGEASPDRCNEGWSTVASWSAADPAVLQFVSSQPASVTTAVFLATAPGTTTIVAGGLRSPSGEVQRVELTACTEERSTAFTYECLKRVPLEVQVLP